MIIPKISCDAESAFPLVTSTEHVDRLTEIFTKFEIDTVDVLRQCEISSFWNTTYIGFLTGVRQPP